jgi:hypothetical protein
MKTFKIYSAFSILYFCISLYNIRIDVSMSRFEFSFFFIYFRIALWIDGFSFSYLSNTCRRCILHTHTHARTHKGTTNAHRHEKLPFCICIINKSNSLPFTGPFWMLIQLDRTKKNSKNPRSVELWVFMTEDYDLGVLSCKRSVWENTEERHNRSLVVSSVINWHSSHLILGAGIA